MNTVNTTDTATTPAKSIKVGKFEGMLGSLQTAAFGDFVRHGMDRRTAHKVCMDYGSDIGQAMKQQGSELGSKVSKANKDGARGFKISGKTAAITESRAMSLKVIVQHLDALHDEELTESRVSLNDIELIETLQQYVSDCEAWAAKQDWSE